LSLAGLFEFRNKVLHKESISPATGVVGSDDLYGNTSQGNFKIPKGDGKQPDFETDLD
jgi:hypothetical protein